MDAAEEWLQANDPNYPLSRQGWRHLNAEGEYETPEEEAPPFGDAPPRTWADDPQ